MNELNKWYYINTVNAILKRLPDLQLLLCHQIAHQNLDFHQGHDLLVDPLHSIYHFRIY